MTHKKLLPTLGLIGSLAIGSVNAKDSDVLKAMDSFEQTLKTLEAEVIALQREMPIWLADRDYGLGIEKAKLVHPTNIRYHQGIDLLSPSCTYLSDCINYTEGNDQEADTMHYFFRDGKDTYEVTITIGKDGIAKKTTKDLVNDETSVKTFEKTK